MNRKFVMMNDLCHLICDHVTWWFLICSLTMVKSFLQRTHSTLTAYMCFLVARLYVYYKAVEDLNYMHK
jgi:hypothetical protein